MGLFLIEIDPTNLYSSPKIGENVNNYPHLLPATTPFGDKIVSPEGAEVGALKGLMIDVDAGQVNYAVLSFGSFLELGDTLLAIPWEALTINIEGHTFILNVDKEQFRDAPGFDKDHWPDEAQYESGWLLDLYNYYGYAPYWMSQRELDQLR